MRLTLRRLTLLAVLLGGCGLSHAADTSAMAVADGPFQPNWDSLKQYQCPAWFRDAKFGIWAHWSAQCVPEEGDWYARGMYQQGSGQYQYHVAHYGHPSVFGFKDICNLWKAERWQPDKLIELYKRAGAKYFVALANHHCNFDCWDSTYQPWNSVRVGPHRDIVGTWAAAARRQGLRFGVTVHSARSWDWYDVAHGADQTGPLAGVPYDGALTAAEGKGKWWEGLDPADLYGPHGAARTQAARDAYVLKWYRRTKDLVDKYNPDLLYFDDSQLPLGEAGFRIAAHYYNANLARHAGNLEAVLTTKDMPPDLRRSVVWDIERGISDRIEPYPWQTDTCIGAWHYLRNCQYKTPSLVIHMLADIVSKNGNLLLNIPVRGDGTIDEREVQFLEAMARWMAVNGEAIFSTRPWLVYGEGRARGRTGAFSEGGTGSAGSRDLRFTYKRDTLYVILMGWPDNGQVTVRSLAKLPGLKGDVRGVSLLGYPGKLRWTRDQSGLTVTLPAKRPCDYAWALKVTGRWMRRFRPDLVPPEDTSRVSADAHGSFTLLPQDVEVHGDQVRVENRAGQDNLGFWDRPGDWVSWNLNVQQAGTFEVSALCATAAGETSFSVEAARQKLTAQAPATGDWDRYVTVKLGKLTLAAPGKVTLSLRPLDPATWRPMNLRAVTLKRVE